MLRKSPFQHYCEEYDTWFEENPLIYKAELRAVRQLWDCQGVGIEVGVGTGRFANPLGVKIGIEPSRSMGSMAFARGIHVVGAKAEELPLAKAVADYMLMVTTICFFTDVLMAFREASSVLKESGSLVVAFIDRNSDLGRRYDKKKQGSLFYQNARFYSTAEVMEFLREAGFGDFMFRQTLFSSVRETKKVQPVKDGYGEGGFVVVRATNLRHSASIPTGS